MIRAVQAVRRVAVTGLGVCSPLGVGTRHVWRRLLEGRSGITRLPKAYQLEGMRSQVAGLVPRGSADSQLDEEDWVSSSERRSMDLSSVFALRAAHEALEDAQWRPESDVDRESSGVSIGSVASGLDEVLHTFSLLQSGQHHSISPCVVVHVLTNMPAALVSMHYNLLGPNHSISTACATGLHAVGDAASMIARGACDVMVAGGTEACIHPITYAGLCRIKALSTNFNSEPERASRPFDSQRDGFVMSEGAAVVVMEEMEHAQRRGAPIYAEILGYGMSSDAHHIFRPREDGSGVQRSMEMALKDAGLAPESVGHINAHATSTPLGDLAENRAIKEFFGEHAYQLLISAPKAATGHLLAAAGTLETIFTVLAVKEGIAPPTINLESTDPELDLNYVPNIPVQWVGNGDRRIALTNSFGFGGTNASLCIGEV